MTNVARGQFIWDLPFKYNPPRCEQIGTFARHILKIGDANDSGDDMPTIGDINYLIDHLFITGPENMTLPDCPQVE